jgi:hypothetical protein
MIKVKLDKVDLQEVKASRTISSKSPYYICNSASVMALTLQSANGSGAMYYIKNVGAGTVTVTATGADLIDGSSTKTLAQYASCILIDYAVNTWAVY